MFNCDRTCLAASAGFFFSCLLSDRIVELSAVEIKCIAVAFSACRKRDAERVGGGNDLLVIYDAK